MNDTSKIISRIDTTELKPLSKSRIQINIAKYRNISIPSRQTYSISYTLAGNKIVDCSSVIGASPAGAAPTLSSSSI